jgi:HEAT repeat protein
MADATTRKLVEVLQHAETPQVLQAALVMAGEIGNGSETRLIDALVERMADKQAEHRCLAIDALGKLHADKTLPRMLELVRDGDAAVIESVARAAGAMGAKGTRALDKLLAEAHPFLRKRIAAALAQSGSQGASIAGAHALLDSDAGVVEAAARSLAGQVPNLPDAQKRGLADYLIRTLQEKRKPPLTAASEAAMLRVLSALHHPKTEDIFWKCIEPHRPPAVRSAGLQALGTLPPPRSDSRIQVLLKCAAEKEFQLVAPALMLLKTAAVSKKLRKEWLRLLDAPDVGVRGFAIERLGERDEPGVIAALLPQLEHADRGVREKAFEALKRTPRGRLALIKALVEAKNVDDAWTLARAQAVFASELPTAVRGKLFAQACRHRDADDRRADPLFFLLREIDAAWLRDEIEARGLELRKKKDYAGAVSYLKMLLRDPACSEATRFELACTGLKASAKDVAPEARQHDPTLAQFTRLLHDPAFELLPRLKKAKFLDAEDLFYLGFHFSEQQGREQQFGADVLRLLVERSPRSPQAKDAKRKLKSVIA